MENVLYILGAGFSAPLGIPVMGDFMMSAKDMFAENNDKYSHFKAVFDKVNKLHTIKSYIYSNLHNIEEVLSLLEMNEYVGSDGKTAEELKRFIKDVISHYTPQITDQTYQKRDIQNYIGFIKNLLKICVCPDNSNSYVPEILSQKVNPSLENPNQYTNYAIITLNYDSVIENCIKFLGEKYHCSDRGVSPNKDPFTVINKYSGEISNYYDNPDYDLFFSIAKIHGSVDSDIIPPTWNKTSNVAIQKVWQLAKILIEKANQIRFLGYSLPKTDTHFKYLLMSGIMSAPNIKKIDALCLDDKNGSVEERYRELIIFNKFRFKNEDIAKYINGLDDVASSRNGICHDTVYNNLECKHQEFFRDA